MLRREIGDDCVRGIIGHDYNLSLRGEVGGNLPVRALGADIETRPIINPERFALTRSFLATSPGGRGEEKNRLALTSRHGQ